MKYLVFSMTLLAILFLFTMGWTMETNLMPLPAKMSFAEGKFRLEENFTISVTGKGDDRLYTASTRALRRLSGRTGLFFPQDFITAQMPIEDAAMSIECQRPGRIVLHEDESYSLAVSPEKIRLAAETDIGVLRGLETFLQLLSVDDSGYFFPAVRIDDTPRYEWRGLLIDACRHFMPVDVIKRNLDGMAAVKLNVLHWHLTEDQGFRIESKCFPKLHLLGSDGFYYSQAQIRDIVDYASDRGIRIVPEFDMPGHATSWIVAYPELGSAPAPSSIERKWGIKDPTMDPTRESTYLFLEEFIEEMCGLFPDEYFHIGGDENNGRQWDANEDIQVFMKEKNIEDNHALQSYFNNRILDILTKNNKKMVGWDEILHPLMPRSIVIQSWRGRRSLIEAARQGYMVMLSNGYYIDLIQSTDYHYLNDPIPPDSPLTEEEKKFILGGEATMWAEFVVPETVDSRIWPRTAAIAERFWSPGNIRDVDDMYRRLEPISIQLEELGLTHIKNQCMMLRRLCNGRDIRALKNFMDVIEPVKEYQRLGQRVYTSFAPMTRVVDAALPDATTARLFRREVDQFIAGEGDADRLLEDMRKKLEMWRDNHADLIPVIHRSPILAEIESLSEDLTKCSNIGLDALDYITKGEKSAEGWVEKQLGELERAKRPRGQAELMIVTAVENLVKKAGAR